MPQLLETLNASDMQSLGLQLSAADIYSVNHSSLKDAVVQFGGGCTGEVISSSGLIVTNHHCGFSQIQGLSSIQNNYIDSGYWAPDYKDEFPCPGLTVTFIKEIIDVTGAVTAGTTVLSEDERVKLVKSRTDSIEKANTKGTYSAFVRAFYYGNQYFLFKTEVFKDIRFVGAPSALIGKFGGETDNWMWPRHGCDFSLFRIYADSSNRPAPYSKNNIPYHASSFLKINIGEKHEGDFTLVYGFPGRTFEYLPASSVNLLLSQTDPVRVKIRDVKLDAWRQSMQENDTIHLQYAAKFNTLENYYKKWKGEIVGLTKFNVVEIKRAFEDSLRFVNQAAVGILDSLNYRNEIIKPISLLNDYYAEAMNTVEIAQISAQFKTLLSFSDTTSDSLIFAELKRLRSVIPKAYRNYSLKADHRAALKMLRLVTENLEEKDLIPMLANCQHSPANLEEVLNDLYSKSNFTDSSKIGMILRKSYSSIRKKIAKDPAYAFYKSVSEKFSIIQKDLEKQNLLLNSFQRKYMALLMEADKNRAFYPDANSTMRVSYGNIKSVNVADGKIYNWYTTTDGILEKHNDREVDYRLPSDFAALLRSKDFGRYGQNGKLTVAFLSSVHTTGGNSGSPVFNGKGELIGINFDRMWEGILSDYYFDEGTCRNISLDVRYLLFIVDKYGHAQRLINEMEIVGE